MLSMFFKRSSIHGMQYLGGENAAISKVVWFVAIVLSFTSAFFFVYMNIINFFRRPIVVTNVEEYDVKVRIRATL